MKVRLWGVRGTAPTPEKENWRYGGNTSCVEVRLDNGTLIILDCGTGLRALGKSLESEFAGQPLEGHIFLTHFHWDHLQGIPFFVPFYKKGNTFSFYSPLCRGADLRRIIEDLMRGPYFPVAMDIMPAERRFLEMDGDSLNLHGAVISALPLNHPQGCAAYRIEADGGVLVLATDTEPGSPAHDASLRRLARNADLLLYDAQYTPQQSEGEKKGWGHSTWQEGVRIALEAGVRNLALFHHDPDSDDTQIDSLVLRARQEFPNTTGAAEGTEFCLQGGQFSETLRSNG